MMTSASLAPPASKLAPARGKDLLRLSLGTLGVVYGDIGTSPLYAVRECFSGEYRVAPSQGNVLGVLSLIFWSLTVIISVKYLAYVMRADNRGEGGILALMALASREGPSGRSHRAIVYLGLFGAALLYSDGMITPAISVLSAVEGLNVAAPSLSHFVQPITIAILVFLFFLQRRGTARIGALFSPVTMLWFATLATLGINQIARQPVVLQAVNPGHAARFFIDNGGQAFFALGSVFLVVTGGEALYADMGHFGARPIRLTWFAVVLPALLLNYFGQGALLLSEPQTLHNPFFLMAPDWALYPLLVLSTLATIIASQAVISGAFSLTRQATMLGYWPRVDIQHTSDRQIGQIYVPSTNWMLMFITIGLVLGFKSSSNLVGAYGMAVTTTMVTTTLLAYIVFRHRFKWSALFAVSVTLLFLLPDLSYFSANLLKIPHGGWFPLLVASSIFLLMLTWKRGRELLAQRVLSQLVPLEDFFEVMRVERATRVPGSAVFLTSNLQGTPTALLHNFQHNRVVHERVILLTLTSSEVPRIEEEDRVTVERLPYGFVRITARYGFLEHPDVPALFTRSDTPNLPLEYTTFFLGRETLLAEGRHGMSVWRERLFAVMSRNARRATAFFNVPPDRVLEVGSQVEL